MKAKFAKILTIILIFALFLSTETVLAAGSYVKIGNIYYGNLRSAITAVQDGETITISGNNNELIKVSRTVTFTVSGGWTSIYPGEGYLMTEDTDPNAEYGTAPITYSFFKVRTSLAQLVASVQDGETITIFEDNYESITVSRAVSFSIVGGTANIQPGDGYDMIIARNGDTTTYTFTVLAPGHVRTVTAAPVSSDDDCPSAVYSDVDATLANHDAIDFVTEKGLMNGTGNGKFSPNSTLTRGMIVTILYRLEGSPAAGISSFKDVPSGKYYTAAVSWAASKGIVSGYGNGKFGPDDNVTGQELVQIMCNYAKYSGYAVNISSDLTVFSDFESIALWAHSAVSWAVEAELVSATNGNLGLAAPATRAEVAQMLMNYCEKF
jgi:hypothetical protein